MIRQVLILLVASAVVAVSCSTDRDPCLEPLDIQTKISFKRALSDTGTSTVDTTFYRLMINPINAPAVFTDSGISGSSTGINLSPLADSCSWYLQADRSAPEKSDTITFYYDRRAQFLSNACGYVYNYNINRISYTRRGIIDTIHSIDSVVINNPVVSGATKNANLTIYFKAP